MSDSQDLLAKAKASLENPQPRKGWVTLEREYKLITPLFGGGPTPGEVDPVTPIRGTEIRGQLRFWWRATRGGRFDGKLKKMKESEDKIWGSDSQAAKVMLAVRQQSPGSLLSTVKVRKKGNVVTVGVADPDSPYSYAAFPLRDKHGALLTNVNFTLRIAYPDDCDEDVRAALWAWETFGGIGARARRGFGAIHHAADYVDNQRLPVQPPPCNANEIKKAIKNKLDKVAPKQWKWPRGVPHLASNIFLEVVDVRENDEKTWLYLINQLRKFRQSRAGNDYGPTHWPEGNVVRRAAGRTPSGKSPDLGNITPRAQLGLPIIFHFPQEDTPDGTLKGKKAERMASRLILRPLRCANGQAVALAAVLKAPIVPLDDTLILEVEGKEVEVTHKPSSSQAKDIVPLDGETSLIKAFFNQLRGKK